jgi:F0F1-type ATP synthase membrane subunit b/b'
MKMLTATLLAICSTTWIAAAGCAQQSPAQTQADVDKAAAQGAHDVATARHEAEQKVEEAQRDLTRKEDDVVRAAAAGDRKLTVAEAEARYQVALQRCDFQTGDARSTCRERADAAMSGAKASVEASKAGAVPQG